MFASSTQCKHWMFSNEEELNKLRENANATHIQKYGNSVSDANKYDVFLTPEEEKLLFRRYEIQLKDFCKRFQPPMPRSVIGTAIHYFKRFYLKNSVMNYHPKEIVVTCVYLACKIEEFDVSIQQFVSNVKGDKEKATDIIIHNEHLVMWELNYHLTIHNPFRAVEGLLIDIKTRSNMNDPERLRPGADMFLERAFLTDVILLYTPSQLALAAILHAASKLQENLDSYVTDILFGVDGRARLEELIEAVRNIRSVVKMVDTPLDKNQQKLLDRKLEKCRNPENNPDNEIYKKRLQAMLDDGDDDISYSGLSRGNDNLDNMALNILV